MFIKHRKLWNSMLSRVMATTFKIFKRRTALSMTITLKDSECLKYQLQQSSNSKESVLPYNPCLSISWLHLCTHNSNLGTYVSTIYIFMQLRKKQKLQYILPQVIQMLSWSWNYLSWIWIYCSHSPMHTNKNR